MKIGNPPLQKGEFKNGKYGKFRKGKIKAARTL